MIARLELPGQERVGEAVFDLVLDHPAQGPRPHFGVVALIAQLLAGGLGCPQRKLVLLEPDDHLLQFKIDDLPDLLAGKGEKDDQDRTRTRLNSTHTYI